MQADLVLERSLRVFHLDPQAAGRERERELLEPQGQPSDTLSPTSHTDFTETTAPNSAIPYGPVKTIYLITF